MKNGYTITMILAAAAMTLGTTASAQTSTTFKAEIPFAFQIGSQHYDAGKYQANIKVGAGGARMLLLSNEDSGKTKAAMVAGVANRSKNDGELPPAKLVFRCGDNGCALAQLWNGSAPEGLTFHAPKTAPGVQQRLASIRLQPTHVD